MALDQEPDFLTDISALMHSSGVLVIDADSGKKLFMLMLVISPQHQPSAKAFRACVTQSVGGCCTGMHLRPFVHQKLVGEHVSVGQPDIGAI
jgi:hypothetical protein